METLHLRAGYGYWDITSLPIGGSFHRAPKDADLTVSKIETMKTHKGADRVGYLDNGHKIAFAYASTAEGEAARVASLDL